MSEQKNENSQSENAQSTNKDRSSRFYKDYFRGYEEIKYQDSDGIIKTERVYAGNYYEQNFPISQRILLRVGYLILYLCAVVLYITSATASADCNYCVYVSLPQAISVPFLFWIGWSFLSYFPGLRCLKEYDYRHSVLALRRSSICAAISLACTAAAILFYFILSIKNPDWSALPFSLRFLLAAALIFAIYKIEGHIPYKITKSNLHPENTENDSDLFNQLYTDGNSDEENRKDSAS